MRFTDRQLKQISGMTDKGFKAKYKVKGKLTKKQRRKRNKLRRKQGLWIIRGKINNISQWRRAVLKRDDYTCQDCGSKTNLHAHHIKRKKEYPKLRLDVNNGKTLCRDCHDKVHQGLIEYYRNERILREMAHES